MVQVVKSEDCGNSPKNLFAQEMAIALSRGDLDFLRERLSDDVQWRIVGKQALQGKDDVADFAASQKDNPLVKISIQHVATHGKAGAVNGTREFDDESTEDFCDVYEFTNTRGKKVGVITSYVVK